MVDENNLEKRNMRREKDEHVVKQNKETRHLMMEENNLRSLFQSFLLKKKVMKPNVNDK